MFSPKTLPVVVFVIFLTLRPASNAASPIEERSLSMLATALQEKNPDGRKEAVVALSLAANREHFLDLLESALDDKDVPVKLAVVASLSEIRTKRAIELLRKALAGSVPEVSFVAAKALWMLKDPAGKSALMAVVAREEKTSSGFITTQMRDTLRMMQTPKAMFIFALRQGIGFMPLPGLGEGIASLQGLLSDPGVSGRASAALLLGRDKDPAVRKALEEALLDKDWSVRAAAVHALALQNDPVVESEIAPLLDDKKEGVRLRAAAACLRLESIRAKRRKAAPAVKK